jgi:DICT domain-containing protein
MSKNRDVGDETLSIGAVAARTNVSVAVLRAWEHRFGFPVPERTRSGHRRYTSKHVEQIVQVLSDRDAGWSLEAAIDRVREEAAALPPRLALSISTELRRRRPELPVHSLSHRAMLAVSHAIEDEFAARAARPVLIGSFQRDEFFAPAQTRWRDLAQTAELAMVFADFRRSRVRAHELVEISVPDDASLRREWAVICDAPEGYACLVGFERPPWTESSRERVFDALWTCEPEIVRHATEISYALASHYVPRAARMLGSVTLPAVEMPAQTVRRTTALTSRVIAYLQHDERRRRAS